MSVDPSGGKEKTRMANLDRSEIVALLGRLGDQNQETVVDTARELHRKVTESGLDWNDLLRVEWNGAGAAQEAESEEPPRDETGDKPAEAGGEVSDADKAEATRLIGRLLARKDLSDSLREELTDMKRAIAQGGFDAMDSRYVRALARRLGA
jgi:hypothetical protein